MPTIADYRVITDQPFTLSRAAGGNPQEDLSPFNLESGAITSTAQGATRPVIMLRVAPLSGSSNLHLRLRMNGTEFANFTGLSTHDTYTLHEAIGNPGSINLTGNVLLLRLESGTGGMSIADIVLLYQRNIGSNISP